jgi:hypothetical protein
MLPRIRAFIYERARGPFGSSVRRITSVPTGVYASSVILLEIGLIVAVVIFFVAIDLYVRGCEHI